ncbi:MAG: hypothetical protein CMK50_00090 [Propionibacteriaceae bacterium]|nr:hypothetical protein [Propionibacteriaceae bacterium]
MCGVHGGAVQANSWCLERQLPRMHQWPSAGGRWQRHVHELRSWHIPAAQWQIGLRDMPLRAVPS